MKTRILTIAIALMLVVIATFSTTFTTLAADVSTETTQGTNLTYNVAQSFTVVIPDAVVITGGTGTGEITVSNSIIPFGESLKVTITDATNYDDGFRLRDGTNDNYLSYTIKNGAVDVVKDTAFLTVAAGTATGSATLTYTTAAATKAGNYTDTLTFTVVAE